MQAQNQFLDQSLLMAAAEEDRLLLVPLLAVTAARLHLQALNLAVVQAIAVVLVAALRLLWRTPVMLLDSLKITPFHQAARLALEHHQQEARLAQSPVAAVVAIVFMVQAATVATLLVGMVRPVLATAAVAAVALAMQAAPEAQAALEQAA